MSDIPPTHLPVIEDPDCPLPGSTPIGIMDLSATTCRWPVRPNGGKDWCYCGLPVVRGAYCEDHGNIAYSPSPRAKLAS